jgi:hypothetical protein|tara:strand:+ start:129 stop:374 length:246 start_codon:yes stop_codon:yes gene_type:complete
MATDKEGVKSMIDIMVDYRKGLLNLDTAMKALEYATDLGPGICEKMLKNSNRDNVTQIRGYSNEPKRLLEGKKGKPNEAKK